VLLVISDPGSAGNDLYTEAEEQAIADYVNNGGALLLAGDSDYTVTAIRVRLTPSWLKSPALASA